MTPGPPRWLPWALAACAGGVAVCGLYVDARGLASPPVPDASAVVLAPPVPTGPTDPSAPGHPPVGPPGAAGRSGRHLVAPPTLFGVPRLAQPDLEMEYLARVGGTVAHPLIAVYGAGPDATLVAGGDRAAGAPVTTDALVRGLLSGGGASGARPPSPRPSGALGGQVVCGALTPPGAGSGSYCAWVDGDVFGTVVRPGQGDAAGLVDGIRGEVER